MSLDPSQLTSPFDEAEIKNSIVLASPETKRGVRELFRRGVGRCRPSHIGETKREDLLGATAPRSGAISHSQDSSSAGAELRRATLRSRSKDPLTVEASNAIEADQSLPSKGPRAPAPICP